MTNLEQLLRLSIERVEAMKAGRAALQEPRRRFGRYKRQWALARLERCISTVDRTFRKAA